MNIKFEKNVLDFANQCKDIVGNFESEMFDQTMWTNCAGMGINSPIEQIFYHAWKTLCQINFIDDAEPMEVEGKFYMVGCCIRPQYVIGDYRVDFEAYYNTHPHRKTDGGPIEQIERSIIIECDSQTFHERNEKERRYEKERDRFLQKKGYKVFHYTGSEIVKKPFSTAADVLSYLTNSDINEIYDVNYLPAGR